MSTKSERERRREERLAAEKSASDAQRRRLMLGYAAAGRLTLVVVVGLVLVLAGGNDSADPTQESPGDAHIEPLSGSVNGVAPDGSRRHAAAGAPAGRPDSGGEGRRL